MRKWIGVGVIALALASCGGDDEQGPATTAAPEEQTSGTTAQDDGPSPTSSSHEPEPEPSEPLQMNTIRIGSQVWERTLPMTSGQCFVFEASGGLPTSANVWGTLDGDDDLGFAVRYNQDGTFEAEVNNNFDMYWIAGYRAPEVNDLVVELDFENLTISGGGTFTKLNTGALAMGSFLFQCEEE